MCVGTNAATSAQGLSLARAVQAEGWGTETPEVWATVGLHPHEASTPTTEIASLLADGAARNDDRLVAVGECGLDYHYEHSPRADQRRAFADQIALAHGLDLALVIHPRDAWDDLFAVLGSEGVPARAVLHCFTGGPVEVRRCLDAGLFVSFSGIVTFKNATDVRRAVELCPLDRLLVETDSPFLAPAPHRGRPNEPALVAVVGETVARVKDVPVSELARTSDDVAKRVFAVSSNSFGS